MVARLHLDNLTCTRMRLGFDATALSPAGKGLARVQHELLRAFSTMVNARELVVFVPEGLDDSFVPRVEGWEIIHVPTRPMILWEQLRLPQQARQLGLDMIVTTSERAALFGPPTVPYIFEHPRRRAARQLESGISTRQRVVNRTTVELFRVSMRRAAHVLVASEATAADLRWIRRLSVVPAGVSDEFSPDESGSRAGRNAFDAADGYILHLASDDPRDNTAAVVRAYARLSEERAPLVIAGGIRELRPSLDALAQSLGVADSIRWPGFLGIAELINAYRGALLYVDPSLYEGFGLQALEAMACGTPVVTSNTTSLPEVVGSAGLLVDPLDVGDLSRAIDLIAGDPALAIDFSIRGRNRAKLFTWERTAAEILHTCEAIAATRRAHGAGSR